MKQVLCKMLKVEFRVLLIAAGILIHTLYSPALFAQSDSAASSPELIAPALQFAAVQKSDNTVELRARLTGKVNGRAINFYKMKISVAQVLESQTIPLGFAITDGRGKVTFTIKGDSLRTDTGGKLTFKASFEGNKSMSAAEESVTMKRARLEITPVKGDSTLSVTVKFMDMASGTPVPVKDIAVSVLVKRLFLPLKVAEGATDENGEAVIEFPNGLPGDKDGNLTILARVDENESYGNLEASSGQKWGAPANQKIEVAQRALWSTHPPMWMLITFIILMTAVWGHYLVIVYELFRLRKEQPVTVANTTNT